MKLLDTILHSAEPLTPRGVVAFVRAPSSRLLTVQCLVAAFSAACIVWCMSHAWLPVVGEAVAKLPDDGRVRRGQLVWRGDTPVRLAANHFLSLAVDVWHEGDLGNESHVSVEFGRVDVRLRSILGYTELAYPADWAVAFNRAELEPWWGAWWPWILAGAGAGTVAWLFAGWLSLALIYAPAVWLAAFFFNRDLNWRGAWRLASAALLPGAIFMALNFIAYGLAVVDLVELGAGFAFHFVIGWIYLLAGVLLLPRHPETPRPLKNPFARA